MNRTDIESIQALYESIQTEASYVDIGNDINKKLALSLYNLSNIYPKEAQAIFDTVTMNDKGAIAALKSKLVSRVGFGTPSTEKDYEIRNIFNLIQHSMHNGHVFELPPTLEDLQQLVKTFTKAEEPTIPGTTRSDKDWEDEKGFGAGGRRSID